MWSKKAIAYLDQFYPPVGGCMICGGKDKRHRLWDTWLGMADAGNSAKLIASVYEADIKHVRAVIAIRPYHRGGKMPSNS